MNIYDAQRIFAVARYYKGGIDGDPGRKTMRAVEIIERNHKSHYPAGANRWGVERRVYAAAQAALNAWGFEAGAIDGFVGHNTREAYRAWDYKRVHGKRETVSRRANKKYTPIRAAKRNSKWIMGSSIPLQRNCRTFYGTPGQNGSVSKQIVGLELPFRMRIDYSLKQSTNSLQIHKLVAPQLQSALISVHSHYGEKRWRQLGLDRYAGGYQPRKMRGGRSWSMHAYGCAIDIYAAPNGLRTKCPQALFCGDEYQPFLNIMEAHGWLPAIRLWGKDAMHFQVARLR